MLSVHGRKPAAVVVEPIAKAFLKLGLTPNVVTIVGTIVTIAISVILIPTGHLFSAAVLSGLFAAFDMLDGTMARLTGKATALARPWMLPAIESPMVPCLALLRGG